MQRLQPACDECGRSKGKLKRRVFPRPGGLAHATPGVAPKHEIDSLLEVRPEWVESSRKIVKMLCKRCRRRLKVADSLGITLRRLTSPADQTLTDRLVAYANKVGWGGGALPGAYNIKGAKLARRRVA